MVARRKLKVRNNVSALIAVYQDGTDADADASAGRLYNNAFRKGALPPGKTRQIDRDMVDLRLLKSGYADARTLTFGVDGIHAWKNDTTNSMIFDLDSEVEFFAEVPDVDATVGTPDWHLNGQTPGSQVRMFYGHISDVNVTATGSLEVTCKDPTYRANGIKLVRSYPDDVVMPKLVINVPRENPDFLHSIKIIDPSSAQPWGLGETKIPIDPLTGMSDARLTLKQVFEYLQFAYNTQLVTESVLDGTYSGHLFASEDLGSLNYKPGPIVLENTGFADGVREILRRWAPHLRLIVDARTTQWRLVQYGPKLTATYSDAGSFIEVTGHPYHSAAGPVADTSIFHVGQRVRIYGGGTVGHPSYQLSQEVTVYGISGTTVQFVEAPTWSFQVPRLFPVDPDALPNKTFLIDDTPQSGASVRETMDGTYTAVNLYSIYTKTTTWSENWNRSAYTAGGLQPGWDNTFEAHWTGKDGDREADFGADGQGLIPYKIDNDGTNDYITAAFSQSSHGPDHATGEWNGVSIWLWTENGGDVRNSNLTFTIKSHTNVADIGDGSTKGIKLVLDQAVGGVLIAAPNFKTIAAGGTDRFVITQNYRFPTTKGNNKRWEVGRMFYFTDTTVSFNESDSTPHITTCKIPKIQVDNGTGSLRQTVTMNPNLGYPMVNQSPSGPWEQLAGGGLGSFFVWRRATYARTPTGSPCPGGTGWTPPVLVQVTYEQTTTTLRNARYPLDGYGGTAFARFGIVDELDIAVINWAEDAQTADYTALAFRLWQIYSTGHFQGQINKPGLKANGAWLDLCITASLNSTLSQGVFGSTYGGFWGTLTDCTYDFGADEVILGFDSQDRVNQFASEVYEEFGVQQKSIVSDLIAQARASAELPECLAGSQTGETPQGMCGDNVYVKGGDTITHKISVLTKPQQNSGAGASGVGMDR